MEAARRVRIGELVVIAILFWIIVDVESIRSTSNKKQLLAHLIQENHQANIDLQQYDCWNGTIDIVESIPVGIDLQTHMTTYSGWTQLLNNAQDTIELAEFYFTLTDGKAFPVEDGGYMGANIFQELVNASSHRNVTIRIVQNMPNKNNPDLDSAWLADHGMAQVKNIDWPKLVGGGILHTKLIIADDSSFYVGSANADWRSLSQVKELGVLVRNCPLLTQDIKKIWEMYWMAADMTQLPDQWPSQLDTSFNVQSPAKVGLNGEPSQVFLGSSPRQFCSPHRTEDDYGLVNAIDNAQKFIDVEVMDYSAGTMYLNPNYYWGNISNALIRAAFNRNVNVRLLFSIWPHTNNNTFQWQCMLNSLKNVQVKLFKIPDMDNNVPIPYSRVNHAKYLVTDQQTYIGTSNWTPDYFIYTGGISFVTTSDHVRSQVSSYFERDWNSAYTFPTDKCQKAS